MLGQNELKLTDIIFTFPSVQSPAPPPSRPLLSTVIVNKTEAKPVLQLKSKHNVWYSCLLYEY